MFLRVKSGPDRFNVIAHIEGGEALIAERARHVAPQLAAFTALKLIMFGHIANPLSELKSF